MVQVLREGDRQSKRDREEILRERESGWQCNRVRHKSTFLEPTNTNFKIVCSTKAIQLIFSSFVIKVIKRLSQKKIIISIQVLKTQLRNTRLNHSI
jgi:hypothetical protein